MDRRNFLAGATATSALALAACERRQPAQRRSVTVAQWGQEKYLIYLPFYIAQEAGIFADNQIDVTVNFSGNDDATFATVVRGDAQYGIGDPIFAAIARERGADGVVVGQIVGRVALWGVSRTLTRQLRTPADFQGLRVGTFPRPSTAYTLLRNMIDQNEVTNAQIAEVPIGSELALLESNGADLAMMLEPAASVAEAEGYRVVTSFPSLWGPFAFTGLTSTQANLDADPDLARDMRHSMQQALELAHTNNARAIEIAQGLFPSLAPAVVTNAVTRMLTDGTIPQQFAMPTDAWSAAVRVRQEMNELGAGDHAGVVAN